MFARVARMFTLVAGLAVSLLLFGCTAQTELVAPSLAPSQDGSEQAAVAGVDDSAAVAPGDQPPEDEAIVTEEMAAEDDALLDLSSQDVFEKIEESIVFVVAPDGSTTGSGIVLEDGWVLTNAHVVQRNTSVRIGRSDGEDLGLFPVHGADWNFDLALIGPLPDGLLPSAERGVSADLQVGARALLIGFPDEGNVAPTPTLTEGIVSRRRYVALGDFPFLQVDATLAPGQSGGALVNGRGEVVGVSGLIFGEGGFGLVFAADAMWPRVDALIASGAPQLPDGPGETEFIDQVGPLRSFGFVAEVDESGRLDLEVNGVANVVVDVRTLSGSTVDRSTRPEDPFNGFATSGRLRYDLRSDGSEQVAVDLDPGFYEVLVTSLEETTSTIAVTSDNLMRRYPDVEEGANLPIGEIVEGSIDWLSDADTWSLVLEAGQNVRISADGISDPVLAVRFGDEFIVANDDQGGGLFGTSAHVDFIAPETGTYDVEVGVFNSEGFGYLIEAIVD